MEPLEWIIGLAVGAAVASPTVRRVVRRGIAYGLAGVRVASDKAARVAHSVVSHARQEVTAPPAATQAQGGAEPTSNQAAAQPSTSAPA
jgi:hypothetical protein